MDKLIVGILLVCFTTFCGYLFARKYRQRKKFFTQWTLFNERFLSEIAYYRRPIKEFYQKYEYESEFNEFLLDFIKVLSHGAPKKETYDKILEEFPFLEKEDKSQIVDYFLMLGRGDSGSQKSYFSSAKASLSTRLGEVENQAKRYGDLYVKLGFLLGLALLVIIV